MVIKIKEILNINKVLVFIIKEKKCNKERIKISKIIRSLKASLKENLILKKTIKNLIIKNMLIIILKSNLRLKKIQI